MFGAVQRCREGGGGETGAERQKRKRGKGVRGQKRRRDEDGSGRPPRAAGESKTGAKKLGCRVAYVV